MTTLQITGVVTNVSGLSQPFTGTVDVIDPPVVSGVTFSPEAPKAGDLVTITVAATDPQNEALTFSCEVNGVAATASAAPGVFTWQA